MWECCSKQYGDIYFPMCIGHLSSLAIFRIIQKGYMCCILSEPDIWAYRCRPKASMISQSIQIAIWRIKYVQQLRLMIILYRTNMKHFLEINAYPTNFIYLTSKTVLQNKLNTLEVWFCFRVCVSKLAELNS